MFVPRKFADSSSTLTVRVRHLALEAADDAGQRDGPALVGDHEHVGRQAPQLAVERAELLAVAAAADDDVVARDVVVVEGVQRLPQLEHHVVRDVDDVVDRTLLERDQPLLQPLRRGRRA